jgi:hypothetical protein
MPRIQFTALDEAAIRQMWADGMPIKAIQECMGYSDKVFYREIKALGLPPRPGQAQPWTEAEDAILRAIEWPVHQRVVLNVLPRRTWPAIQQRAQRLGISIKSRSDKSRNHWTPAEDDVIRQNYGRVPVVDWLDQLPGRTRQCICGRARHGLKLRSNLHHSDQRRPRKSAPAEHASI